MVNEVVLRSQAQAVYAPENFGHFGLNLRRYAHFTSPIRRYADLIVHRALIRALDLGPDGFEGQRDRRARGDRAGDLRHRAPRDGRRARDRGPFDRRLSCRPYRRDLPCARLRLGALRPLRAPRRRPAPMASCPAASIGHEYFFHDESRQALVGEDSGASLPTRRRCVGPPRGGHTHGRRFALRDVERGARPQRQAHTGTQQERENQRKGPRRAPAAATKSHSQTPLSRPK